MKEMYQCPNLSLESMLTTDVLTASSMVNYFEEQANGVDGESSTDFNSIFV